MADAFIGEIRMFAGSFAPVGWLFCDGQILQISEYDVLYSLIITTYGGDGVITFALPDMRGRIPVHQGQGPGLTNRIMGQTIGTESVAVTGAELPAHTHTVRAQSKHGNTNSPLNAVWASSTLNQFAENVSSTKMQAGSISSTGQGQPHNNMMPFLGVNFIICTYGIYPSQS
jgi:microcystin-dependent protein